MGLVSLVACFGCGALAADPPVPEAGRDPFGVTMLYPTRSGGETWFLSDNPLRDARFDPQDALTRNADGSWKVKSEQVRMQRLHLHGLRLAAHPHL